MKGIINFFSKLLHSSDWLPRWHSGRRMDRINEVYKSEEKYRHLFENNPLPLWVIDLDSFAFLDVNEAAILHYGYTREEFLSMTALDIRTPEEVFLFKQADHSKTIGPAEYNRGIWKHRKKDGTIIQVEVVAHNIQYQGKPARFILSNDVTARLQAEEALRGNQQLLSKIFDNSEAVIYIKDLQGRYLMVNRRFRELLKISSEAVTGKTDYQLFPVAVADALRAVDKRAASSELPLTEQEVILVDGKLHTYISVKSTLPDANGIPYAVFGISTDITRVKVVEENLRKSLQDVSDYKHALDESSIVAITDQKGRITYVNDNFCRISQYDRAELIGQDHRIIKSGHHPALFIKQLWHTIANGNIWRGELKNRAKDGSFYWVDTTIIPFLDEQGKPSQYIAIRSDITSRKQAESELYKMNEELEKRVELRTTQLEAANRELEAFSYSVSHDLRAPLRGIIGFTTMLEEDYTSKLDDEARRLTNIIKTNTLKMGHLIDGLLMFSRMTRQDITKSPINTGKMVADIIEEMNSSASIEWHFSHLPFVVGDFSTLRQVWINLISNAIKYSSTREKPYIEIGGFHMDGQTGFFVKDNGVGFDNKYVDKLFKVFQRLHRSDEFEGTGVGLALVEKIISKHGGKVWADGTINQGACFYFSLPDETIKCSNI
jgi:PAS domain S-box-containing protein